MSVLRQKLNQQPLIEIIYFGAQTDSPGRTPPSCVKVSPWLRHFQRIAMDAARVTMESHLAELARAREFAIAHGQISAGVQAEHYRGIRERRGFLRTRIATFRLPP